MKIKDIKTYCLVTDIKVPFYFGEGWIKNRSSLIVELLADDGIVGWGEGFCHGNQPPEPAQAVIEKTLKPMLLGKELDDVNVLWDEMYYLTQPYGRNGVVISAISAVDVAIWDCLGKAMGKPVYKLLGGAYRTDVPAYASGFFRTPNNKYPEANVEEALGYVAEGYTGMKVKAGYGLHEDISTIHALREAIGPDVMLMVDANCAYNVSETRKLLKAYDECDVFWLEEPLAPDDFEGYLELKNLSSVYIASCENEFTKYGFRRWITNRAVDIIQPDLCYAGGFTECIKIINLAQTWHMQIMPHAWGSRIGQAASMQLLALVPPTPTTFIASEPMLEFDKSDHPFRNELVYPVLNINSNGRVSISDKPGIGIEVNRDVLKYYSR